jgi:hypothetical protein
MKYKTHSHNQYKDHHRLVQCLGFGLASSRDEKFLDILGIVALSFVVRASTSLECFGDDEEFVNGNGGPAQNGQERSNTGAIIIPKMNASHCHSHDGTCSVKDGRHPQACHLHHDGDKIFFAHEIKQKRRLDEKEPNRHTDDTTREKLIQSGGGNEEKRRHDGWMDGWIFFVPTILRTDWL